jgi:ribokinase
MSAPTVVVVVGSLHHDIMIEAPDRPRKGETVAGYSWRPKFGGKGGNQARAAAAAGAEVRMVGAVGDDYFGRFLLEGLQSAGVDASRVAVLADRGSGMSVAISDSGGDYGAVIVSGANLAIADDAIEEPELWSDATALILQNEIPDRVNLVAAAAAHSRGVLVCLNAAPYRPIPPELQACVDVLVVNAIEAEQLYGRKVDNLASAGKAADDLTHAFPCVVVTAGSDGVAGCRRGEQPVMLPAIPVKLVSTHGAGDAFVGMLGMRLATGDKLGKALELANTAAAEHVATRHG